MTAGEDCMPGRVSKNLDVLRWSEDEPEGAAVVKLREVITRLHPAHEADAHVKDVLTPPADAAALIEAIQQSRAS